MHNTAANTVYTISISSLAIALIASLLISVIVIVVILKRSKAKITASELQLTNRSTNMEPLYEEATGILPSVSASINTQENFAYGHTKTSITAIQT